MKTFIFLVTMWQADGTPPDVWVIDSGLTGEDCIALLESYSAPNGEPSCEIDRATAIGD